MKGVKKRMGLFLLALFSPELAKSKLGYRTVAANGFIPGISPMKWALILVSSAVFGIAATLVEVAGRSGRFRRRPWQVSYLLSCTSATEPTQIYSCTGSSTIISRSSIWRAPTYGGMFTGFDQLKSGTFSQAESDLSSLS